MQIKINWVVCLVQDHTGAVLSDIGPIASATPGTGPALSLEEHTRPVLSGMEPIQSGIGAYRAVLSGIEPIPSGTHGTEPVPSVQVWYQSVCYFVFFRFF